MLERDPSGVAFKRAVGGKGQPLFQIALDIHGKDYSFRAFPEGRVLGYLEC